MFEEQDTGFTHDFMRTIKKKIYFLEVRVDRCSGRSRTSKCKFSLLGAITEPIYIRKRYFYIDHIKVPLDLLLIQLNPPNPES